MHDEAWGPRDPRDRRGGHKMRARMRGGAPWGGPGAPLGGPGGPFDFGPRGGPFGPRMGGRGPRVRRGDVRAAILDLLAEGQPWNGYQIIQEIAERTQGVWRPSAGSVYPALQQLEDEGLISAAAGEDRKRNYTLTDEGRASWDAVTGSVDDAAVQIHNLARTVAMATVQVAQAGTPAQIQQASKVLADTRKALYRILAADG